MWGLPWWGWVLVISAVFVILPVKMRILKKMLDKNNKERDAS